jgi:hypothetical protein
MTCGIAKVCLPLAGSLGFVSDWDGRTLLSHLVAIAVAGFLLWLAANRLEWFRLSRRQYSQSQEALFAELCQAHDLSRTERRLLSLISQTIGDNGSCSAFVDPRVIQQFAQNNPADAQNCLDLCRRLFGTHAR